MSSGTYAVRARNRTSSLCTSAATTVTINSPVLSPAAPSVTITAQPSCTLATGTITVTSPSPGAGINYSINGTNYTNTTGVFTGVAPGTYPVTVRNLAGCISPITSVTVNAQPPTPAAPTATVSTQPSCTLATGTITTPTGAGLTYSINGTTYTNTTGLFSGLTPGTYSVTVRNGSGCTSSATSLTVNAQPATPVLSVNSATVCAGISATLTAGGCTGGTLTWSTGANTTSLTVTPVATTIYSVTCSASNGCSATASKTVVVRPTPTYTQQPTVALATCTGALVNADARITVTTLQNTERADIVAGSSYGAGPAYGAASNRTVTGGTVSFGNLPNPATSQPYTIRLFSTSGLCTTDVTVTLSPADCRCSGAPCPKVTITAQR